MMNNLSDLQQILGWMIVFIVVVGLAGIIALGLEKVDEDLGDNSIIDRGNDE